MTIYALRLIGVSGVAVVRISWIETEKIINLLTNSDLPQPRKLI